MAQAHFMVDTETLALGPDAVILSLGACRFFWSPHSIYPAKFYMELNSNLQPNRKIDSETLAWWGRQPNMPAGVHSITETVKVFNQYLAAASNGEEIILWCRGTDFDIPKLRSMFAEASIPVPWKYNNVRDLRTLSKLFPLIKAPTNPNPHNALADAEYQAMHAATILYNLCIERE